jgi:streptogramin lyase
VAVVAALCCSAVLAVSGSGSATRAPLALGWPVGIDVGSDGSLLVVEFTSKTLWRVDPSTGRRSRIVQFAKPWGVAHGPAGRIYVSDSQTLERIDGHRITPVATAPGSNEIGPVTVTPAGDVVYATPAAVYRLRRAAHAPVSIMTLPPNTGPHGIAIARDASILLSDPEHNVIWRIAPASGKKAVFARLGQPRGIDVARDGSVYVCAATAKRVLHLSAAGKRIGMVGPVFGDPYALTVAPNGTVFAIDTGATGYIRRIAPDGSSSLVGA